MKISACMIVRDEQSTLVECLESIKPHVDELVIVDTGSKDSTPEIAKRYADKFEVFTACNDSDGLIEDFAMARNRSFELATHDWAFWLDGDDIVENAQDLRSLVAQASGKAETLITLLPYDYTFDEKGRCNCVHWRERLVYPRALFHWVTPVHEVLLPKTTSASLGHGQTDRVRLVHRRRFSSKPIDPRRNLRILLKHIKKSGEGDVRGWYYLGLEHMYVGEYGHALRVLRRYVQLSGDWLSNHTGWVDEKCLGFLAIAKIHMIQADYQLAIEWASKAIQVKSWQEPYWIIARAYYGLASADIDRSYNLNRAAHFAALGLNLPDSQTVLFLNPKEKFEIHEILNVCLKEAGDLRGALESCRNGLKGIPDHPGLLQNAHVFETELVKTEAKEKVVHLQRLGALNDQASTIVQQVIDGTLQVGTGPGPDSEPRVIFFLGEALERWSPDTLRASGAGGSETMAWNMARLLAQRGCVVRVYADCAPEQEKTYEGVEWFDSRKFGPGLSCDLFVSSRRPDAVDCPIDARRKVLWVHDVHCGGALTEARATRFDEILALSEWHRALLLQVYPFLQPSKVVVTRNGIDLARFSHDVKRDPHRSFYTSSPDRGLLTAVECWPRIRRKIPDAELRVFYGFDNWEKTIQLSGDFAQNTSVKQLRDAIEATDGVELVGKISGERLAREMLGCGVWAYSTWFSETSCISSMEAQAAGCFSVTSPIAALNETCDAESTAFITGDWRSEDYKRAWTKGMLDALEGSGKFASVSREGIQERAKRFALDTLADDWVRRYQLARVSAEGEMPSFEEFRV